MYLMSHFSKELTDSGHYVMAEKVTMSLGKWTSSTPVLYGDIQSHEAERDRS